MRPRPLLLVAAGAHRQTTAMQRACDLARRAQLPIHVCLPAYHALIERSGVVVHPDVMRLARTQFLDEQRDWLEALAARWKAEGLEVTTEVVWAPAPAEAALASIRARDPELVIKDAGHESLPRRILNATVDLRLLRHCPSPLLLVHERSERLPRRILAAVDTAPTVPHGRALNELVIREALKQGDLADAEVHVAHAFPYVPVHAHAFHGFERVFEQARQADLAAFTAFADEFRVPQQCRHWIEGNPPERLAAIIESRNMDLVVLGSAYHTTFERMLFLGGTAEGLLFKLPCDALLVKPEDARMELSRRS